MTAQLLDGNSLANKIQAEIAAKKQLRTAEKMKTDQLLDELERMKKLLDDTPAYVPPPATVLRLPNPRPYPEAPVESKILITGAGVLAYRDTVMTASLLDKLKAQQSRFKFRDGKPEDFGRAVAEQVKDANLARAAWPEINPLASRFQYWQLGAAYKSLHDAGIKPNRAMLEAVGDIAVGLGKPMPDVAAAIAAIVKGDHMPWKTLDPAKPPRDPLISITSGGGKLLLGYAAATVEGKTTPDGVADAFRKLADSNYFKGKSKDREMYDARLIKEFVLAELRRDSQGARFDTEANVGVEDGFVGVTLKPKPEFIENPQTFPKPDSIFTRMLKDTRSDPAGVVIFRVTKDGFSTYHEARRLCDELEVPATWEYASSQDLSLRLRGYETQLPTKVARVVPKTDEITIKPPKRTLD